MLKPLTGFTVVTLALNVPGPLAAASLRDDGAQIIKVEPPAGDPLKVMVAHWYEELHQAVEVRTINLKEATGQAALANLLSNADLLLTSHRPSALARLNLSPTELQTSYPQLCRVSIVGDTREPEVPGHDLTYQVEAGLIDPSNPVMPRTLLADLMGSREAYAAALALLLGRERGSPEREKIIGLGDSARFAAQPYHVGLTAPGGILSGERDIYRLYRTANGWVAAAPLETHFAQRWTEIIGPTPQHTLQTKPTEHWTRLAQEHDLPLVAVE